MSAYLDASVLLPTVVDEPTSEAVDAFIFAGGDEFLVSDFAAAEVASGLSRLIRTRLLSEADAAVRLNDFEMWRAAETSAVEFHAADARLAYTYVRRFDLALRTPDALHIAITRRLDATLVTSDRRMARAASELGVAVHFLVAA